jgi:hypothetical protein
VAILFVLGDCAEGNPASNLSTQDRALRSPLYGSHLIQHVARDGSFPVVIQGNLLALPKSEAHQVIARPLRLPVWTTGARFVPVEDAASRRLGGNTAYADAGVVRAASVAS